MRSKLYCAVTTSILLATAGAGLQHARADANEEGEVALVCYQWTHPDAFSGERLRLSIRKPAPITETTDPVTAPPQQTWGLTGKHVNVCGGGTVSVVRGTVIADETSDSARMGIHTIAVRGEEEVDRCRAVAWNCVSLEGARRAPAQWACEGRNEFGVYLGAATLSKMSDADDACFAFEVGLNVQDDEASGTLR